MSLYYIDTSAAVKLLVAEAHSPALDDRMAAAARSAGLPVRSPA